MRNLNEKNAKFGLFIINNILEDLHKLFAVLRPLIEKMIELEEFQEFYEDGTFGKIHNIFKSISDESKKIGVKFFPNDFIKRLKN
jgi:hypothetical protein